MAIPSEDAIKTFILEQYRLWSENRIDDMISLIRTFGSNGYSTEYVGSPVLEGEAAMADMIPQYAGKISTQVDRLIVNGHEAAAVIHNHVKEKNETVVSMEVYNFGDGTFHARYFH